MFRRFECLVDPFAIRIGFKSIKREDLVALADSSIKSRRCRRHLDDLRPLVVGLLNMHAQNDRPAARITRNLLSGAALQPLGAYF